MKFFATMVLVFTALTAVMTYPQVLHLRDGVHDDGDPLLNTWALAWVAHQLPRAPARLFDANIFAPERRTLAYSETMLLPGLVAAPMHWLGVSPLLVHNLVLLSGFVLSGAGTALLVRSITGQTAAAILAGIVFAFLPYRIDHMPHVQLQQTQCLPLALWSLHRVIDRGRIADGLWFGAFAAGQIQSCVYYGLFLAPYLAVVGALLLVGTPRREQAMRGLAAGGFLLLLLVLPVGRAYFAAHDVVGERGVGEVAMNSATPRNYLAPPEANLLYGDLFHRFTDNERRLFPGFVAVALSCVALWPRKRDSRARDVDRPARLTTFAYAAGLVVAVDISLGFNGLTYPILYKVVTPFRGLRVPARMGLFAGFSLAVLAGLGAARVMGAIESPRRRQAVAVLLGVLMLGEYASKPLALQTIPTEPSAAYADLLRDVGDSPTATIFEFPATALHDPTYMYFSTFHWQNLVNGYSGFFPPWYGPLLESMRRFPNDASVEAIRAHGSRYLLVHGERLLGNSYRRITYELDRWPGISLLSRRPAEREGQHGEISVYRLISSSMPQR